MRHASDVMETGPLEVSPEVGVHELARRMVEGDVDGACVVEGGRLVGVVTSMDLVFQEKKVHLPTVIHFIEAVIPLDFLGRTERELEKITGGTVRDIMTREPYTAKPSTAIDEVATRMVEDHLSFVPVLEGGAIVGVITRRSMLKAAAG